MALLGQVFHSLPYAMLADALPKEELGLYMGIFNALVVMPQILITLSFGWFMEKFLGDMELLAVITGGVFLILAAGVSLSIEDEEITVKA